MSQIKPLARRSEIVIQEIDNEILIYDLKDDKAFALNEVSSKVWQCSDGKTTIEEIAKKVSVLRNEIVTTDIVWLSLEQLKKENLIEDWLGHLTQFEGLSRREIVRKIGFASLTALPVVVSIVAPSSINAASCAAANNAGMLNINGCACTGANACQNNCCGSNGSSASCVSSGLDGIGAFCRAACECASNCCTSTSLTGTCAPFMTLLTGNPCTVGCQCSSGSCPPSNMCS